MTDGCLVYVSNYLGREFYRIRADGLLTPGRHRIRFTFTKTGDLSGRGTLELDGSPIGTVDIERTNPAVYAVAEGLEVGSDGTAPVSPEYASPATFNGTIHRVTIEVGDDHVVDLETEARVAEFRQ